MSEPLRKDGTPPPGSTPGGGPHTDTSRPGCGPGSGLTRPSLGPGPTYIVSPRGFPTPPPSPGFRDPHISVLGGAISGGGGGHRERGSGGGGGDGRGGGEHRSCVSVRTVTET